VHSKTNERSDSDEEEGNLGIEYGCSKEVNFIQNTVMSDITVTVDNLVGKDLNPFQINVPSARDGNSCTVCEVGGMRKVIIFGGRFLKNATAPWNTHYNAKLPNSDRERNTFCNDVHEFDVEHDLWSLKSCTGSPPHPRSDHSAVLLDSRHLVVFGGRGKNGQIFNDTVVLSCEEWQWQRLETKNTPMERYWHGCCSLECNMFIFGGKADSQVCGDLATLEISRYISQTKIRCGGQQELIGWNQTLPVGEGPSPCFGSKMITLNDERIAVIGGWKKKRRCRFEKQIMDVHILDTYSMIWSKPKLSSNVFDNNAPLERFMFECFYAYNIIVIFGGYYYAEKGERESYIPNEEQLAYKLDITRMIWRRQPFNSFTHSHSTFIVGTPSRFFTCNTTHDNKSIQIVKIDLKKKYK
jgi:hypothetical protein